MISDVPRARIVAAAAVVLAIVLARETHGQGIASGGRAAAARAAASGKPWPVAFFDTALASGVRMRFTSGDEIRKKYIVEANGSGVAFLDYDSDGLLDLFLVNGSRLDPKKSTATNYLYKNAGDGKFVDVTATAGLARSGWGNGVCAGDIDNDGNLDLYVTYWGPNALYRNRGDGTFADVSLKAGVAGHAKQWSTGCTFVDYDRDGRLDLAVTSYLDFDVARTPLPGQKPFCLWKGVPVYCGPRGLPPGNVALYRNEGDGTFRDVSERSGFRSQAGCYAFTAVATDFTGDGWPDVYVACDSTPSLLFRNQRDGTFREVATESGLAYNEHGTEQAGMGVAVSDFDNDGRLDVMKTNFSGDYPNLYRGSGKGIFSDVATRVGLGVNPDHILWGAGFADLDNDGLQDVVQVSGHVYPEAEKIDKREAYKRPRLVYRNLGGGKFEDVSAVSGPGSAAAASSRGAAFGDFDNDGDIDVLIMNMHEAPSLLRNDLGAAHGWVKFVLQGTASNRSAIGAIVTIEAAGVRQSSVVLSQSSFLSVNDLRVHFGLGSAARVDHVTVQWPSGTVETFPGVQPGALYKLLEGSGQTSAEPLERRF